MSGNAYKRTVLELEGVLEEKLAQLKLLEDENTKLRRREAALSTAVGSVEGSVNAKARVLRSKSLGEELALSSSSPHQQSLADRVASLSSEAMLAKVEEMEKEIKKAMRQLGAGAYNKLYSTQLLHKAAADPDMTAAFLAADPATRRAEWAAAVRQLALLLPKYDFQFPCSFATNSGIGGSGTARQQVDSLIDEITSKVLIYGLLDPPPVVLHDLMVNLEKGQVEPYPPNYWKNVAAGVGLTTDQKHVLQFSWQRVKENKAQHQQLSARLTKLQQEVQQRFKQFEQQVQQAMQHHHLEEVQQVQIQLQQQQAAAQQQQQQALQELAGKAEAAADELGLPELPLAVDSSLCPASPCLSDLLANWQAEEDDQVLSAAAGMELPAAFRLETATHAAADGTAAAAAAASAASPADAVAQQQQQQQQSQSIPNGHHPVLEHQQQQQQQQLWGYPPSPDVQLPTAQWQQQWIQQQQQQQQVALARQQQQQQQLQQQEPPGPTNAKEEVLLNQSGEEQRHLEQELDRVRQIIKLQHYCQVLQLVNTVSKKQLATLYVLAWPYMPDAFMLCEELEGDTAPAVPTHSV